MISKQTVVFAYIVLVMHILEKTGQDQKAMKQTMIVLSAVITLGVLIAFLLYELENKTIHEQQATESWIPEKKHKAEKVEKKAKDTETDKMIRVLLKTDNFQSIYHPSIEVSSKGGLQIETRDGTRKVEGNKSVKVKETASIRSLNQEDKITIHSIKRGCGAPSYAGEIELMKTEEGIVIVNELPLEAYLCGVVPSEMSASYEMEALKAQAVCARCYAYNQMENLAYSEYKAHVDDSVSFQVYNNWGQNEKTNQAVEETKNKMLWYGNNVAKTYFYSTSNGYSTSVEAWGSNLVDENKYLSGVEIVNEEGVAYEEEASWYRWSAQIADEVLEKIVERNAGKNIGRLKNVKVTKRGPGNIVQCLEIRGSKDTIVVETENKIRRILGGKGYEITRQDGKVVDSMELLPSAFFTVEKSGSDYVLNGGGYGHGIGMSQNGANELAKSGKTYEEILEFFYPGTNVE